MTGLLYWLVLIVMRVIASNYDEAGTAAGSVIIQPVAAIFMFLPVFIYGGWLAVVAGH